jgi:predicted transposase YbfD/YdcC
MGESAKIAMVLHWVMDMIFRDDECRVRKDDFSEKLDS